MTADTSLVIALKEIKKKHPVLATSWLMAVNQLHKNAMGNNTVNEIMAAFLAIDEEESSNHNDVDSIKRNDLSKGFLNLAEACFILAKYNKDSYALDADHDIIYAHVDADKVTEEDRSRLDALGWHIDSEFGYMAMFT